MLSLFELIVALLMVLQSVYGSHAVIGNYSQLNPKDCGITRLTKGFEEKCFEWHNNPIPQLKDGRDATVEEAPWTVQVEVKYVEHFLWIFKTDYSYECMGSVIADQWVLTAAHCLIRDDPGEYTILLGYHSLKFEHRLYRTKVLGIHTHPNYNTKLDEIQLDDLALLKMKETIKSIKAIKGPGISTELKSICLPEKNILNTKDEYALFAGLGKNDRGQMPIQMGYKKVNSVPLNKTLILVTVVDNQAFNCQGDSGGTLYQVHLGRAVIIGVNSYGTSNTPSGCSTIELAENRFTRVSYYIDWIKNVTQLK